MYIPTEPHSVMQAINRQIAHYAYHVGQIVFLAKHFQSNHWKCLSVPRGKPAEFNAKVALGEGPVMGSWGARAGIICLTPSNLHLRRGLY